MNRFIGWLPVSNNQVKQRLSEAPKPEPFQVMQNSTADVADGQIREISAHGFCSNCQKEHFLPTGRSKNVCYALTAKLAGHGHLGFLEHFSRQQDYSMADLFGDARGKMFGVLEGVDPRGNSVILYAFSGQINGQWVVPGWAPPLFDLQEWKNVNDDTEKTIKNYTTRIINHTGSANELQNLKRARKELSQQLMKELHSLYTVKNFRGESAPLHSFYSEKRGIPTGAGDCCAPKLLNHAFARSITPVSMAEFYWGKTNRSQLKKHGCFYPTCRDKCYPLLGFMLCGLESKTEDGCLP